MWVRKPIGDQIEKWNCQILNTKPETVLTTSSEPEATEGISESAEEAYDDVFARVPGSFIRQPGFHGSCGY